MPIIPMDVYTDLVMSGAIVEELSDDDFELFVEEVDGRYTIDISENMALALSAALSGGEGLDHTGEVYVDLLHSALINEIEGYDYYG